MGNHREDTMPKKSKDEIVHDHNTMESTEEGF